MLLLDNYRLKKELVEMADRLKVSEEALNLERDRRDKALATLVDKEQIISKQAASIKKKAAEIKKLAALVREQTGADLLVNALRELGVVPKPEKAPDAYSEQERLLRQSASAQQAGMSNTPYNSLGAASGLQGVFGRGY